MHGTLGDAVDEFAALVRAGKSPGIASFIAARNHGLEPSEVARAAQQRAQLARAARSRADGELTLAEAHQHVLLNRTEDGFKRRAERALAARIFVEVMTQPKGLRDIRRSYLEIADGIDLESVAVVCRELRVLFETLGELDPRPLERTNLSRHCHTWPAWADSCFVRRMPRD